MMGLVGVLVLLGGLAATIGLGGAGWVVGITCAAITSVALGRGLTRDGLDGLGPADRVTLTRAMLACGVAALTADSFGRPAAVTTLVSMTVVALVLDWVDGWVARRTKTASRLGARFDMEVDAFLILVLSVYVARTTGAWVLAIGAARYALLAAGWLLPWLRATAPPRPWCRVVAAIQGVVLAVAAADVLPRFLTVAALAVALAVLTVSFGREVWWLWRHRPAGGVPGSPGGRRRLSRATAGVVTGLAVLLVWFGLTAPNRISHLSPTAFARIPLEALVVVVLVLVLPRARRATASLVGLVLGLVTLSKLLDMGYYEALGRPFNAVIDWRYLGSAVSLLDDSVGRSVTVGLLTGAALLLIAVLVLMPLSVLRLTRIASQHRVASVRAITTVGVVWLLCAVLGVRPFQGDTPIASVSAAEYAYGQVSRIPAVIQDQREFARAAADDPLRDLPPDRLLTGLRGKDVVIAFVESYGRVAVQDSAVSPGVDAVLDAGTRRLRAAGFLARSAFLTSPTFSGVSWLAHSTFQSGLWADSQQRYDVLVASDRFTLSDAFRRAGWRTVGVVPANTRDWPEGTSFYHYDQLYDSRNVGYAGPKFGYATMPDQYTLSAFQRLELAAPDRAPVMAEVDLITSHAPWVPLPRMVEWSKVGDGSVFDPMPAQGQAADDVWPDQRRVQAEYGQSIEYALNALVSFVETYAADDLVLIVLGDHQPAPIVSGEDAGHDVPITVIAHDAAVLDRISGWRWQDGMNPGPDAPIWRMDEFRDRFLSAFGR